MIKRKKISKKQIDDAIANREFGPDVTGSNSRVAVVMTQSWCPQWSALQAWMSDCEPQSDLDCYELIYDKDGQFDEILDLKEKGWKNDQIPYIRYYKDGRLTGQSNYVSREKFDSSFK